MAVSYAALADSFRLRISTIHYVIKEVCEAIWKSLAPLHVPVPTTEMLLATLNDFCLKWNFLKCVGSIDGKHIRLKCLSNSGSMYYNYKHYYCVVLQGLADSWYRFITIGVGAYGRQSDGEIFVTVHSISFCAVIISICLMLRNYHYQMWNFHL